MEEPVRTNVWKMFNTLANSYDRVNRVMTLGIDQRWRSFLSEHLPKKDTLKLLDCATGTADQILTLLSKVPQITEAVGIDLAEEMLAIGRTKVQEQGFASKVTLIKGDVLQLPFSESSFDCVTIAFGIRNFTDPLGGLKEMCRVLHPGGRLMILECSLPEKPLLRSLHLAYLRHVLPKIGALFSGKGEAYVYLNKTIETFPHGQQFLDLMEQASLKNLKALPLMGGVVTLYLGDKKSHL